MPILEIRIPLRKTAESLREDFEKFSATTAVTKNVSVDRDTKGVSEDAQQDEIDIHWLPLSNYYIPLMDVTIKPGPLFDKVYGVVKDAITEAMQKCEQFSLGFFGDFFYSHKPETAGFIFEPYFSLEQLTLELCKSFDQANSLYSKSEDRVNIKYLPCLPYLTIAELDTECPRARTLIHEYRKVLLEKPAETIDAIEIVRRNKVLSSFSFKPKSELDEVPKPESISSPSRPRQESKAGADTTSFAARVARIHAAHERATVQRDFDAYLRSTAIETMVKPRESLKPRELTPQFNAAPSKRAPQRSARDELADLGEEHLNSPSSSPSRGGFGRTLRLPDPTPPEPAVPEEA